MARALGKQVCPRTQQNRCLSVAVRSASMQEEAAMDDRLMKMEVKIAYMEETITTLDSVVTEQNTEIANLKNRLSLMEKRFSELIDDSLPAGEKPPHY